MQSDPFISTLQEWIEVLMRNSMRHFIRYARGSGLSMSHLGAMFHIHRMGSCGVTDLGDHLGVTCAASSQMLDRLVQQGFILRAEDPKDRRVKQIVLTDKGCRVLKEGIRARQDWLGGLAQTLSDSEKETVMAGLNILINRVKHLSQLIEAES
jgi:DNA-binding MarR family transcriptional regulator